jgi:hypothetical protein
MGKLQRWVDVTHLKVDRGVVGQGLDDVPERRVLVAENLSSLIVRVVDDLTVGTGANLAAIWSNQLVGLQVKMTTVSKVNLCEARKRNVLRRGHETCSPGLEGTC